MNSSQTPIVKQNIDIIHQFGIIDTCNIYCKLHSQTVRTKYIENRIPHKHNTETGEVIMWRGNIKNLLIFWNNDYIKIVGSWAKYHFGNNLTLLTRTQTKTVVKELSQKLIVDLMLARITRLDIAFDIQVTLPVKSYFHLFEEKPRMVKTHSGLHSLYFNGRDKQNFFYDKKKQLKQKEGISINVEHLMRFEVRFMKSTSIKNYMQAYYHKPELTIADLVERNVYLDFVRHIGTEYFAIKKKQSFCFDIRMCGKPNDILSQLALCGIGKLGGLNEVLHIIDNSKNLFVPPYPEFISRIKGIVRKLSQNGNFIKPIEAIDNLDFQVKKLTQLTLWSNCMEGKTIK